MKESISLNSIVVAVKDQVSADLSGEVAILHLKSGVYYGLNGVGTEIWNFIKVPRRVKEIYEWLLEKYKVASRRCERELLSLLNQLVVEELVRVKDGKPLEGSSAKG